MSIGVRCAIDDFGTGYCGLRYLGSLPVDALKIDRSFVQGMTPSDAAIIAATIAMGHSLGLTVIAEGVETEEQRRFLTDQGCDRIQGYLTGRPMPADAMVDRIREEQFVDMPVPEHLVEPAVSNGNGSNGNGSNGNGSNGNGSNGNGSHDPQDVPASSFGGG